MRLMLAMDINVDVNLGDPYLRRGEGVCGGLWGVGVLAPCLDEDSKDLSRRAFP